MLINREMVEYIMKHLCHGLLGYLVTNKLEIQQLTWKGFYGILTKQKKVYTIPFRVVMTSLR